MSQKQLAELLNVTPQTISKWENDLSKPGFQMITEMTNIFHISHDELFIGETEILYKGSIYTATTGSSGWSFRYCSAFNLNSFVFCFAIINVNIRIEQKNMDVIS